MNDFFDAIHSCNTYSFVTVYTIISGTLCKYTVHVSFNSCFKKRKKKKEQCM